MFWLGLALCAIAGLVAPFAPSGWIVINIDCRRIEDPSLVQIYLAVLFVAAVLGVLMYFMNTEKAKTEFGVV